MIIIKSNRIIEPFGIKLSRESEFMLMAPLQSNNEEIDGRDGEIEFDATIKNVEYRLNGIIEHFNPTTKQNDIDNVLRKMLECMELQEMIYEVKPNMITYARITGKVDFEKYVNFTKVNFNLKFNPFWYSATENKIIGNGAIINNGSFETGLIIEIAGPTTNPTLTIGSDILTYNGSIADGSILTIDTEKQTAKIGNVNAMDEYNKVFPLLYPNNEITVSTTNNVTIKWRDKWM